MRKKSCYFLNMKKMIFHCVLCYCWIWLLLAPITRWRAAVPTSTTSGGEKSRQCWRERASEYISVKLKKKEYILQSMRINDTQLCLFDIYDTTLINFEKFTVLERLSN